MIGKRCSTVSMTWRSEKTISNNFSLSTANTAMQDSPSQSTTWQSLAEETTSGKRKSPMHAYKCRFKGENHIIYEWRINGKKKSSGIDAFVLHMAETWVLSVSNMCIITLPYCRFRDSYSTAAPQILCWHVCWLNTLLTLLMHKFESIWGPVSLQVGKWISGAEQQIAEPFVLEFQNQWSVSACLSQAWMLPVSALQHITMPYAYSIIFHHPFGLK